MTTTQIDFFNSDALTSASNTASLAAIKASREDIKLNHGSLQLYYPVFPPDKSQQLFESLLQKTPWRQDTILMHGRNIAVPRLQAWYGDATRFYQYSGIRLKPEPWTNDLLQIKALVEEISGKSFNSVLLNLYRDGKDSVSWHSDDEPELGLHPTICSLSLGNPRRFMLRQKQHQLNIQSATKETKMHKAEKLTLMLPHNSLLVMGGEIQKYWQHAAPKTTKPVGQRLNLTFRQII